MRVLGLDPSLTATGWCLFDTSQSGSRRCERWGEILSDSKLDEPVRYGSIQAALRDLITQTNPDKIAMETPIYGASFSEGMYALFVCVQQVLHEMKMDVVFLSVTMAKGFACEKHPFPKGWKMDKTDMMDFVKKELQIKKLRVKDNNRADAYILAYMGSRFWQLLSGEISESSLSEYEARSFTRTHTYVRGKKKGITEKTGLIHRKGERFFLWSEVEDGNQTARIIVESPKGTGIPKEKQDRKPRRASRSKSPKTVTPTHSLGVIDHRLLDRWSTE